jgi:hypothetical protein
MNVFLTVYSTSTWQVFINASGLKVTDNFTQSVKEPCALLSPQSHTNLASVLEQSQSAQQIWVATVQAEHFIAEALDNDQSLSDAAQAWEHLTNELLRIQRKHRNKIKLFNLHQALEYPQSLREHLGTINIKEYSPQAPACSFELLAASQYSRQQDQLKSLNTILQASSLPLSEDEFLVLDIDAALKENRLNTSEHLVVKNQLDQALTETSEERDLILAQLHQVQEELESYYHALQSEKVLHKNDLQECKAKHNSEISNLTSELKKIGVLAAENTQLKHTLLAHEKQSGKEIARLESDLRKIKARAASAEFAGHLLQQELNSLQESISWKAATPVRMIGRLVKKTDEERETRLQQIGLLLTSEYFDLDWYLRTYTDVAESKMNPAEHYLLFGANEGRFPGPLFDGNWYLQQYPDVAAANLNPLLHFIMHGQEEGRISSPKLPTNNQQAEE